MLDQVKALRTAIRRHRDSKGDDRCWLDDLLLWKVLPDSAPEPDALPSIDDMMKLCRAYYENRRSITADPMPEDAVLDQELWDMDLVGLSEETLAAMTASLESAIRAHRDIIGRERTLEDDRKLYAALPEKLPADFRLPSEDEFLGEAKKPYAGCPSFWRSHQGCGCAKHELHAWGPCKNCS